MPFELKITANSLEELWNTLATFKGPTSISGIPRVDLKDPVSPDTNGADTADTVSGSTSNEGASTPPKRGPGRPPGSGNKSKPSTLPPAFVQSVKSGPDEPEDEAEQEPEDAGGATTAVDDDAKDDEIRAQITTELGRYWKKNPAMKQLIQAFRAELGISTMLDLSPEDFPKARALIAKLKAEMEETAP